MIPNFHPSWNNKGFKAPPKTLSTPLLFTSSTQTSLFGLTGSRDKTRSLLFSPEVLRQREELGERDERRAAHGGDVGLVRRVQRVAREVGRVARHDLRHHQRRLRQSHH